jgi:hypothetical protein
VQNFGGVGGWFFAADPDQSFVEQTVFWAPEVLPTVIPLRPALLMGSHSHVKLDLSDLNKGQLRQGADGWHAVLHLQGVEHRVWLKEAPVAAVAYAVELRLDRDFEFRADAMHFPCIAVGDWRSPCARSMHGWTAAPIGKSRKFCSAPCAFPNATGGRTICAIGPFAWFRAASR